MWKVSKAPPLYSQQPHFCLFVYFLHHSKVIFLLKFTQTISVRGPKFIPTITALGLAKVALLNKHEYHWRHLFALANTNLFLEYQLTAALACLE